MKCLIRIVITLALWFLPLAAWGGEASWMFRKGNYTHNPATGERVAQYAPLPSVEALPDSRPYLSGIRRSRVQLRGAGGTVEEQIVVENWGNGRGGVDAEWERFNDAWSRSVLSRGHGYGTGLPGFPNWGPGFGGYGHGYGYGPPTGYGTPPAYSYPGGYGTPYAPGYASPPAMGYGPFGP